MQVWNGSHSIGIFANVYGPYLPYVRFGGLLHEWNARIVCSRPSPLPGYFNLVKPFSATVWKAFYACLVSTAVVYAVVAAHDTASHSRFDLFSVIGLQLAQSQAIKRAIKVMYSI